MHENDCYEDAEVQFYKELQLKKCNCLPDCTAIKYDAEVSQTDFGSNSAPRGYFVIIIFIIK